MTSKAYVCGPMRGKPNFNFAAFDAAKAFLIGKGFVPVSPADLDRVCDGWIPCPPENLEVTTELKARCMRRDLIALLDLCPENGDCIFVLKGWEESSGAKAEIAVAKFLGLSVIYEMDLTLNRKM